MRRSIFALAVVAAALPGLALAGEPVPMTDNDLDSVAAGLSLSDLGKILSSLSTEQIWATRSMTPKGWSRSTTPCPRLIKMRSRGKWDYCSQA